MYVCTCFSNIFAKLIVNDKEEFRRYLRINTAMYHSIFKTLVSLFLSCLTEWLGCLILHKSSQIAINSMISLWIHSLLPNVVAFVRYLTFTGTAWRCGSFHYWRNTTNVTCSWFCTRLLEFSLMSLCKKSFSSSSNACLTSLILKENRRNIQKQPLGDVL